MQKSCQTRRETNPMVIRWVMFNYGQIPWNGFMGSREKRALLKASTVIDETQDQMPPEYAEEIHAYLTKERKTNE